MELRGSPGESEAASDLVAAPAPPRRSPWEPRPSSPGPCLELGVSEEAQRNCSQLPTL